MNQEAPLIQAVRDGSLDAYEQLMQLHVQRLRAFVALRVPAAHLIDEITHETFVFAYQHLDSFEAGTNLGAWLRAIANNFVRRETQRFARAETNRERYFEHLVIQTAVSRSERAEAPDVAAYLLDCVQHLPEHVARLIDYRYREGRTSDEIAELLDRSASWVRTNLWRTRMDLRKCINGKMSTGGANS